MELKNYSRSSKCKNGLGTILIVNVKFSFKVVPIKQNEGSDLYDRTNCGAKLGHVI